jgi:DNA-binding CsgD family transcriptional regulator
MSLAAATASVEPDLLPVVAAYTSSDRTEGVSDRHTADRVVGRVISPRFIGRRLELDALRGAVDRARGGVGSVMVVSGEAGMGKTRLLAKLSAQARRDGATVLVGECLPLGRGELLYAPITGVLRSLIRDRGAEEVTGLARAGIDELMRLLPDLRPAEPADDPVGFSAVPGGGSQARLFEQLFAVLSAVAREAPLLLVIEDVHWSDHATRDFLSFLVRAGREERIALAITYRSDEVTAGHAALAFVHELERGSDAVRVALGPFGRAEIRELIAAIREEAPDARLVDRMFERAEGNPFFTEELLVSVDSADSPLPESLRQSFLLRLAGAGEDVAAVVRMTSIAAKEIEHDLLEALLQLPDDRFVAAVRDAMERHVLVHPAGSTKYAFRHALMCEVAYAELLSVERRQAHRRLAEVIEREPSLGGTRAAAAAKLAHHWYLGDDPRRAFHASVAAATEAELVYAPAEALVHYERALELWDAVAPDAEVGVDRVELFARTSEAASRAGDHERAIELAREVLARSDPDDAIAVALAHERLGRRLWTSGRGLDALPEYRQAVELMPDEPTAERARVLGAEAHVLMLCHRIPAAIARSEEALELARATGARDVEASVLNTMGGNFSYLGQPERGIEATAEARMIARELGLVDEVGRSYVNGSDALEHVGRMQESIALAVAGVTECDERGDRLSGDVLRGEIAGRLLRSGSWDRAAAVLDELLQKAPSGIAAGNAYGQLAVLCAERGDRDEALRAVELGGELVRLSGGSMWTAPIVEARAVLDLWDGRPREAFGTVDGFLTAVSGGQSVLATARVFEVGARAAADLSLPGAAEQTDGETAHARARTLLARLDELIASLVGESPVRIRASRQTAAAEGLRIDGADPAAWEAAAALWRQCGDDQRVAYARWREAEALLTAGLGRGPAQDSAREAHAIAVRLGARPLREAVEALARRGRLDLGGPNLAPAAPSGLERLELTPRELEVFALLGEGMTNREIGNELFISEKTASVHVSRILAKLSVPNRAAAAAAAQRLGVERVGAIAE